MDSFSVQWILSLNRLSQNWGQVQVLSATPHRIVVCTDPDGCNDDCAALVMLLRSDLKHTVAGIIVTAGNTWAEAGQQSLTRVFAAAGLSWPGTLLLSGAGPLVQSRERAQTTKASWGVDYAGAFDEPNPTSSRDANAAVGFLRDIVHRHPGEVTIVSLAPMTPLALAIRGDSSFAKHVGELVVMAGARGGRGNATAHAEFNAWFDPEAAQVVLRSPIRRKLVFDLRACEEAMVTCREFEAITRHDTPLTRLYRDHMGYTYPGFLSNPAASVPMWDALVAAYLIDPTVVYSFEDVVLDVEVSFGPTYGATCDVDPHTDSGHALLPTGIDSLKALRLYCDLLSDARPKRPP